MHYVDISHPTHCFMHFAFFGCWSWTPPLATASSLCEAPPGLLTTTFLRGVLHWQQTLCGSRETGKVDQGLLASVRRRWDIPRGGAETRPFLSWELVSLSRFGTPLLSVCFWFADMPGSALTHNQWSGPFCPKKHLSSGKDALISRESFLSPLGCSAGTDWRTQAEYSSPGVGDSSMQTPLGKRWVTKPGCRYWLIAGGRFARVIGLNNGQGEKTCAWVAIPFIHVNDILLIVKSLANVAVWCRSHRWILLLLHRQLVISKTFRHKNFGQGMCCYVVSAKQSFEVCTLERLWSRSAGEDVWSCLNCRWTEESLWGSINWVALYTVG